ncbi:MAG: GNAT family N-acetyltransferase [Verrucomicrobiales bacterium]|jgi:putative hemolysin|nr:GNAT family N-acetyltransferase [Verrucomicrobiales bacterium]
MVSLPINHPSARRSSSAGRRWNSSTDEILLSGEVYAVRLARDRDEIRQAQRLRFEIFNLELHEGLESSYLSGLDRDDFDAVCEHLLVIHNISREIVGTYRMQTGPNAARHLGYYSAQEFDFTPYEFYRPQIVELGRACIHHQHRNLAALNLLWRGIIAYAKKHAARYLIGCSSLTSQDPRLGATTFRNLFHQFMVSEELMTEPLPKHAFRLEEIYDQCPPPPRLLRAYLNIGAKICAAPAMDREFKTIDFLTLMDLENLPPLTANRYLNRHS